MTPLRLFAIFLIFVTAALAWVALGTSVLVRTETADDTGYAGVSSLWGTTQRQEAPRFTRQGSGPAPDVVGSDVAADFELEQRRKGLLWYSTYVVDFDAAYRLENPGDEAAPVTMRFVFPDAAGVYDGFGVTVDGRELPVTYEGGTATTEFDVGAGETVEVVTGYKTNGLDEWRYVPTPEGASVLKDLELTMVTDFEDIDFPEDGVSPTTKEAADGGWVLTWSYDSLVSGRPIGLVMPKPLNPGPVASRISFFAPVSLLFYFAALVLLMATAGVKLHPMHYAFLAAGFFAFQLLFAYLADRVDIGWAFAISAGASMVLCVGYLWLVIGWGRALVEVAVSQFVFMVLFSFSFFFEGLTGLAIAIGSVLTLAYFMARTGRVDWDGVFARQNRPPARYAPPPASYPPPPGRPRPEGGTS
jgi:hypothetical protein